MGLYLFSKNTEGPPSEGNLGTQVGAELTALVWGCGAPRADGTAEWEQTPSVNQSGPTSDAGRRVRLLPIVAP